MLGNESLKFRDQMQICPHNTAYVRTIEDSIHHVKLKREKEKENSLL